MLEGVGETTSSGEKLPEDHGVVGRVKRVIGKARRRGRWLPLFSANVATEYVHRDFVNSRAGN